MFNRKKPAPPPLLRRDKMIAMIKADMDLEDAIDRDDDEAWKKASDAGNRAFKGATKAEIKAAHEGADRGSWCLARSWSGQSHSYSP